MWRAGQSAPGPPSNVLPSKAPEVKQRELIVLLVARDPRHHLLSMTQSSRESKSLQSLRAPINSRGKLVKRGHFQAQLFILVISRLATRCNGRERTTHLDKAVT